MLQKPKTYYSFLKKTSNQKPSGQLGGRRSEKRDMKTPARRQTCVCLLPAAAHLSGVSSFVTTRFLFSFPDPPARTAPLSFRFSNGYRQCRSMCSIAPVGAETPWHEKEIVFQCNKSKHAAESKYVPHAPPHPYHPHPHGCFLSDPNAPVLRERSKKRNTPTRARLLFFDTTNHPAFLAH